MLPSSPALAMLTAAAAASASFPARETAGTCTPDFAGVQCSEDAADESGLLQVRGELRAEQSPSYDDVLLEFEEYVEKFGKRYERGTPEYETRKDVFERCKAKVAAHNADPSHSWKQELNMFSDWTPEELTQLKGYDKSAKWANYSWEHSAAPDDEGLAAGADLPQSWDWRERGVVTAVKNQGACGGCWAFAAIQTVESHAAISSLGPNRSDAVVLGVLSAQQLLSCAPNPRQCGGGGGCYGGTPQIAFDYLVGVGAQSHWNIPYMSLYGTSALAKCPNLAQRMNETGPVASIEGHVTLPMNKYEPVMWALVTRGPLAISVDASNWYGYSHGVADPCTDRTNIVIDHAVQLVGYGSQDGQDYWLVRNSWGATWGLEGGYIMLKRSSNEEANCAWDRDPASVACKDDVPDRQWVCGTCGILFDVSYPVGAKAVRSA